MNLDIGQAQGVCIEDCKIAKKNRECKEREELLAVLALEFPAIYMQGACEGEQVYRF